MSITTPDREAPGMACPKDVHDRVKRGRARAQELAPKRNECWSFFRGDQWVYVDNENSLQRQATAPGPSSTAKPGHRHRTTRNIIKPLVRQEVSSATQRIPSYQVVPSHSDQPTQEAALTSEKVALYLYDAAKVRAATVKVVTSAIVAQHGFAWPYWDPTLGTPVDDDGTATGDIRVRTYTSNEVYWEPGIRFDDSRWHCVEQAEPIEDVMARPGYIGGPLVPDATTGLSRGQKGAQAKLVLVSEYLERPCRKWPKGRRIVVANGRQILPTDDYPLQDEKGEPLDEPCLHSLSVVVDPDKDHDLGLVEDTLDAQRTFNGTTSKGLEWVVHALNPQVILQNVVLKERLNDIPGFKYNAYGSGNVIWRPVPPVPEELFVIADRAKTDIGFMFSQNDLPDNVDTARGIQALLDRDQNARADFLANLADFHSRLMRHMLYLVARYYTEERLLPINGEFGWENVQNFLGAHLRSQCDVRVFPDSLEPRTKQVIEQRVMNWAQLGWITPEAAMAAITNGTAEGLVDSYEKDVSRAWWIIQLIKQGPDFLFNLPPNPPGPNAQPDPLTGQPTESPGWMPRWFDNEKVHVQVFTSWMKSRDWDALPQPMREAATLYYQALLQQEAAKEQQAAEAQAQQAEQLGMQNASRPQNKPTPSLPALAGNGNGAAPPSSS